MPATREDVDLLLRLYDMRREHELRKARAFMSGSFTCRNLDEFNRMSEQPRHATYFRQATSYWDMVAAIVNRGLLDAELFFETTGEHALIWEKIADLVTQLRESRRNALMFHNLQAMVENHWRWMDERQPGSSAQFRETVRQMTERQRAASKAA